MENKNNACESCQHQMLTHDDNGVCKVTYCRCKGQKK